MSSTYTLKHINNRIQAAKDSKEGKERVKPGSLHSLTVVVTANVAEKAKKQGKPLNPRAPPCQIKCVVIDAEATLERNNSTTGASNTKLLAPLFHKEDDKNVVSTTEFTELYNGYQLTAKSFDSGRTFKVGDRAVLHGITYSDFISKTGESGKSFDFSYENCVIPSRLSDIGKCGLPTHFDSVDPDYNTIYTEVRLVPDSLINKEQFGGEIKFGTVLNAQIKEPKGKEKFVLAELAIFESVKVDGDGVTETFENFETRVTLWEVSGLKTSSMEATVDLLNTHPVSFNALLNIDRVTSKTVAAGKTDDDNRECTLIFCKPGPIEWEMKKAMESFAVVPKELALKYAENRRTDVTDYVNEPRSDVQNLVNCAPPIYKALEKENGEYKYVIVPLGDRIPGIARYNEPSKAIKFIKSYINDPSDPPEDDEFSEYVTRKAYLEVFAVKVDKPVAQEAVEPPKKRRKVQ